MQATLEHTNYTVSDPAATARWMETLFGWHIRWQGDAMAGGKTVHVGDKSHYLALYSPGAPSAATDTSYTTTGGLNHIAVVVDDLNAMECAVRAQGFDPINHADYEPGQRFYFHDHDGIEYEVVSYTAT